LIVARIFLERSLPADDVRQIFDLLGEDELPGVTGECVPPVDVLETTAAMEIVADLPGVAAESVKVLFARGTILIAGQKLAMACEHREAAFHLAERAFGRFARAVHLTGAYDAGRATATLASGELRIVLPRIEERRGREIRIPVTAS
jgi:HSP20 family protein